jgi:hypothetical protein
MKPFARASMRWMQQRLRYLAYRETHGKDGPLPPDSQTQQSGCAATGQTGLAGTGNAVSAADRAVFFQLPQHLNT